MKPKTILLILGSLLVVSLIVWYIQYQKNKAKQPASDTGITPIAPPTAIPITPASASVTVTNGFPILYNVYSSQAKQIQGALGVTQDGIIGPKTLAALKKYWPEVTENFRIDANILQAVLAKIAAGKKAEQASSVSVLAPSGLGWAFGW